MENYVGKICPFCKTAITADDEIIVCRSCAAPHHKACWDENKGCTTFGCSEQHYVAQGTNPTDVCKRCGAALGDGQNFCPKCGTSKNAPNNTFCAMCGAELADGQEFCPKCGQKVGLAIDSRVSSAISQFNSNVTANNEKKKKKPIIIAIIMCVVVVLGIGGFTIHKKVVEQNEAARIEELTDDYRNNAKKFAALALTAGANVEDIANTEQNYWYDYIYDDKWSSIESAVLMAQIEKSDEMTQAEDDYEQMKNLYNDLKKVPEGVNDDDIDEICDAVKELYNIYTDYYNLAMKIGDDVFAIGAPNGMSYTLTKGTLSSNKRVISGETYLQIDAALNEGNSGGPLLDSKGTVIGMNTMKMNDSEGLGLAIPIDRIIQYMNNNDISISDRGEAVVPEITNNTDPANADEKIGSNDNIIQERSEHNNVPVLIAVICVSVICNIIMLLLTLQYRSKWKKLKTEQSERTDFEIDVWE